MLEVLQSSTFGSAPEASGNDAAHSAITSMTTQDEIAFSKKNWKSLHKTVVLEGKLKIRSAGGTVISRCLGILIFSRRKVQQANLVEAGMRRTL